MEIKITLILSSSIFKFSLHKNATTDTFSCTLLQSPTSTMVVVSSRVYPPVHTKTQDFGNQSLCLGCIDIHLPNYHFTFIESIATSLLLILRWSRQHLAQQRHGEFCRELIIRDSRICKVEKMFSINWTTAILAASCLVLGELFFIIHLVLSITDLHRISLVPPHSLQCCSLCLLPGIRGRAGLRASWSVRPFLQVH